MALRRLGTAIHSSRSKSLIIKLESENFLPGIGTKIFDKKLSHVGNINDIFGRVSSPYASIKPITSDLTKYVGEILYFMQDK